MKFLDFITPAGVKGNVSDPSDLLKLTMGVVVTIGTLAIGQQIAKRIDTVLPGKTYELDNQFSQAKAVQVNDGGVII